MKASKTQIAKNTERAYKLLGKRIPRSVFLEIECIEYLHTLDDQEAMWILKFYDERYNGATSPAFTDPEDLIHNTPEMKSEAVRLHNNNKRDALKVATKKFDLLELHDIEYNKFMEDASDAWEWQDAFKFLGYREAATVIMEQTLSDIETGEDSILALAKFYAKMKELDKYQRKDIKTKRELEKKNEKTNS